MLLSKKRYLLINKVIDTWINDKVITEDESHKLKSFVELSKFDWKRAAKYSFWIAAICLAISVFSILLDDVIVKLIRQLFKMPDMAKAILLGICSAGTYLWSFRRKKIKPTKLFSNEFLLFVGAIISGTAIIFFGKAIDTGSGHYSLLILMASIVYLAIGSFFPSASMWTLGLISLGSWFGTETGYISGWGTYFLGMNFPLRFVLFGALLIGTSVIIDRTKFKYLRKSTLIMGLLNLFLALWLMSIWGNYGDMRTWHYAPMVERFFWSFLFGAIAIGVIVLGLKNDDGILRGFGITFLFINLYTKYFEYFWKISHKAIFFAILAVSFWLAGKYSEKVFNSLKLKLLEVSDDD